MHGLIMRRAGRSQQPTPMINQSNLRYYTWRPLSRFRNHFLHFYPARPGTPGKPQCEAEAMNQKLCKIIGCLEPCHGRSCFCQQHYAEYRVWEEIERQHKFDGLLAVSTPEQRETLERDHRAPSKLRRQVEELH